MNAFVIAIGCCLLAQLPADDDPYRPKVVPSQPAAVDADASQPAETSPFAEQPTTPPSSAPAPAFGLPDEFPASDPPDAGAPDTSLPDAGPSEPSAPEPSQTEPTGPRDSLEGLDSAAPAEEAAETDMAPVGSVPRQRLRPPELLAEALATPQEGGLRGASVPLVAALRTLPTVSSNCGSPGPIGSWRPPRPVFTGHARNVICWITTSRRTPRCPPCKAPGGGSRQRAQRATRRGPSAAGIRRLAGHRRRRAATVGRSPARRQLQHVLPRDFWRRAAGAGPHSLDRPHAADSPSGDRRSRGGDRGGARRVGGDRRAVCHRRPGAGDVAGVGRPTARRAAGLHRRRVRDYNQEIAEYLFAVVRPGTSDQVLVSRLILTSTKSSAPGVNETPAESGAPRTFAPPEGDGRPVLQQPAGDPPVDTQTSNYQPADVGELLGDGGALYRGLVDLHPPARVQKLSGLLHWDRGLPTDGTRPAAFADCLGGVAASERLAL